MEIRKLYRKKKFYCLEEYFDVVAQNSIRAMYGVYMLRNQVHCLKKIFHLIIKKVFFKKKRMTLDESKKIIIIN